MRMMPVNISPEIAELISKAVSDFAEENQLSYDLWYHDDPVWIIRNLPETKPNVDTLVIRVQIAVYHIGTGLELRVIPDAYYIDSAKGKRSTVESDVRDKECVRWVLQELLDLRNRKGFAEAIKTLTGKINSGWEAARNLSYDQLKKEVLY